eukprot:6709821-Prymnesium_polylepis.1
MGRPHLRLPHAQAAADPGRRARQPWQGLGAARSRADRRARALAPAAADGAGRPGGLLARRFRQGAPTHHAHTRACPSRADRALLGPGASQLPCGAVVRRRLRALLEEGLPYSLHAADPWEQYRLPAAAAAAAAAYAP